MNTVLGVLLIAGAVLIAAYWLDFFLRGTVQVVTEEWYLRYQRAFPVADAWLAVCALAWGVGLLSGGSYGTVFGLMGAGAGIFLGLMDLTFNIQNGLFRLLPQSGAMWTELAIIVVLLAASVTAAIYLAGRVG